MNTQDKDRFVKATVVLEIEFFLDKDTCPEDVFNDICATTTTHGFLTKSEVVHTAITTNKKVKQSK